LKKGLTNDIISLANINHTLNKLNTLQEEKTMEEKTLEKTLKKITTNKGTSAEIYQFRILLNGEYCRFLGYKLNGVEQKGRFLLNDLEMLTEYIRISY